VVDGIFLGPGRGPGHLFPSIDPDGNGLPTINGDGDGNDDDGVVILGTDFGGEFKTGVAIESGTLHLQITASVDGFLTAWWDFNGNGRWDHPTERIYNLPIDAGVNTSRNPGPGENQIPPLLIPRGSASGPVYARFRFTTDNTAPLPTGAATNGEVEDYRINVVSRTPWTNLVHRMDVNNDGAVTNLDGLILASELRRTGGGEKLPVPPVTPNIPANRGFLDVDGDNFLTNADMIAIRNVLRTTNGGGLITDPDIAIYAQLPPGAGNRPESGRPEGESEGELASSEGAASEGEPVASGASSFSDAVPSAGGSTGGVAAKSASRAAAGGSSSQEKQESDPVDEEEQAGFAQEDGSGQDADGFGDGDFGRTSDEEDDLEDILDQIAPSVAGAWKDNPLDD
jgi:hypothetical protein